MRSIDRASRVPPWRQIAEFLRADIAAGIYTPDGGPLPSVTRISQEYQVNRHTAHKVLQRLRDEGLIEAEEGMGYYVRAPD